MLELDNKVQMEFRALNAYQSYLFFFVLLALLGDYIARDSIGWIALGSKRRLWVLNGTFCNSIDRLLGN